MDKATKNRARSAASYARKKGTLVPTPCVNCGGWPVHGHHEDYSRPLDVTWLCQPCHTDHHLAPQRQREADLLAKIHSRPRSSKPITDPFTRLVFGLKPLPSTKPQQPSLFPEYRRLQRLIFGGRS